MWLRNRFRNIANIFWYNLNCFLFKGMQGMTSDNMIMNKCACKLSKREGERNLWGRGIVNLPKLFLMLASPFSSAPNDCYLLNAHEKWLFIDISKIYILILSILYILSGFYINIYFHLSTCMHCQSVIRIWAGQWRWTGMDWKTENGSVFLCDINWQDIWRHGCVHSIFNEM